MSLKDYIDNYFVDTSKLNLDLSNFFKFNNNCDHRAKALKCEEKVFSAIGLDVDIYDVPINYDGQNFIHTVECGKKNKEVLVLLHGYSGSLIMFYNVMKELSKRFHVYCIDFLGMGLSSRPEFKCKTPEDTIQYFVESCERWRKVMGLKRYYLGGHSFGGYIAAVCAYKNKKNVKGLYLMSPTGVSRLDENIISEEWAQALGWLKKHFWLTYFQLYSRLYSGKSTPAELVRKFPYLGRICVKKYIHGLIGPKEHEVAELVGECLYELLMLPGGSEQAVHYVLRPPRICAHIPLDQIIFDDLKDMPVHCFFGVEDWNDWTGACKYAANPEHKNFKFEWISESGHQMTLQNPKELSEKVLSTVRAK